MIELLLPVVVVVQAEQPLHLGQIMIIMVVPVVEVSELPVLHLILIVLRVPEEHNHQVVQVQVLQSLLLLDWGLALILVPVMPYKVAAAVVVGMAVAQEVMPVVVVAAAAVILVALLADKPLPVTCLCRTLSVVQGPDAQGMALPESLMPEFQLVCQV